MKIKTKLILSALASMGIAGGLVAGATYSLFTAEDSKDISITAGIIDVEAKISNLKAFSGEWDTSSESYKSKELTVTDGKTATFTNGGTVTLGEDGNLVLDKVSPMDKITCKVDIVNKSNIAIQYRTIVTSKIDTGLFAGLKIDVDGSAFNGITAVTNWASLTAGGSINSLDVSIELPEAATTEYANTGCTISFKAQVVQGNAHVENAPVGGVNLWGAGDLVNFGKKVSSGSKEYAGKTIYICDDIDLEDSGFEPIYAWAGILTNSTIDGMGHTIKNMTAQRGEASGFIYGLASNLTIKDLSFDNAHVSNGTGKGYNGVVVGKMYSDLTLKNVTVTNSRVDCLHQCGILVGYGEASKSLTFENCKVENCKAGGAACSVGTLFGLGKLVVTIKNCTATNVQLYSDTDDWGGNKSYYEKTGKHWVGTTYDYGTNGGVAPTLLETNTETNVVLVDSLD